MARSLGMIRTARRLLESFDELKPTLGMRRKYNLLMQCAGSKASRFVVLCARVLGVTLILFPFIHQPILQVSGSPPKENVEPCAEVGFEPGEGFCADRALPKCDLSKAPNSQETPFHCEFIYGEDFPFKAFEPGVENSFKLEGSPFLWIDPKGETYFDQQPWRAYSDFWSFPEETGKGEDLEVLEKAKEEAIFYVLEFAQKNGLIDLWSDDDVRKMKVVVSGLATLGKFEEQLSGSSKPQLHVFFGYNGKKWSFGAAPYQSQFGCVATFALDPSDRTLRAESPVMNPVLCEFIPGVDQPPK